MTTYSLYCDKMPALSQKVKVSSLNLFLDRGNIRETFEAKTLKHLQPILKFTWENKSTLRNIHQSKTGDD